MPVYFHSPSRSVRAARPQPYRSQSGRGHWRHSHAQRPARQSQA